MRLSAKLILMTAILLLAFAGLGYFSLVQLHEVNKKSTDISTIWLPSTVSVQHINTLTSDYRIFEISYVYSSDEKSKIALKANIENILKELFIVRKIYESLISLEEEQIIYDKFSRLWSKYIDLSQKILKLSEEKNLKKATLLLQNESRIVFEKASIELLHAVNLNKSEGLKASQEGDMVYANARKLITISIYLLIMITACVCAWVIYSIRTQLGKDPSELIRITTRVINGDYDIDNNKDHRGVYRHLVSMVSTLKHHIDNAEENSRIKSDFLANMSHEIRTPMNGVLGLLHLLSQTKLDQKQDEYVQKTLYSANNLMRIIDDILDFSKMEANKLELESTKFTIANIFQEVTDLYTPKANSKHLDFEAYAGDYANKTLIGDPLRIKQVLFNLVSNAIKFTEQGKIILKVTYENPTNNKLNCIFSVEDNGIGLTKEQQQSLFTAFTQADTSTTRKYGGTGLGLAISKKIVETMQGKVWLRSAEGQGATFYFSLSFEMIDEDDTVINDHDKATSMNTVATNQNISSAKEQILLVEDNDINQMIAKELLESAGYKVDIAENGLIALDMLDKNPYDAVLMDIQMPIMDGLTATKKIRQNEAYKNLPVIAMSAHAMVGDREISLQSGMNDHITKPINPENLFASLQHWLGHSKTDK